MSDQSGTSSPGRRGLRLLLFIVGAGLLIAGIREISVNYSAAYDCIHELQCHNEGNTPTAVDRMAAALGFGLENSTATGDPLPSPRGLLLVVGGVLTLVGAMVLGPRRRSGDPAPEPMSAERQIARYEALHERGTLSEEELELRKTRLVEPR